MPTPLVDSEWLQAYLHHPEVVVVDCRFTLSDPQQGYQEYLESHIPTAHYLSLDADLSNSVGLHGGRHPLPDINILVPTLERLGISSQPPTQVVAYDDTKGAFAARLWWLLRYLGHPKVAVLDGGFSGWQANHLPVSTALPIAPQPGQLSPQMNAHWIASRATVMEQLHHSGSVLVDARSPDRYQGLQEPIDPVAGSIPGAVNFFWQNNLNAEGFFKSASELRQQWRAIPEGDRRIFYCGSGVTACVNLLAQAVMGNQLPQIYVGGWSDWCSEPPIEKRQSRI